MSPLPFGAGFLRFDNLIRNGGIYGELQPPQQLLNSQRPHGLSKLWGFLFLGIWVQLRF
jgi:hypothetical protein